jgi:hypothetical protein
MYAVFESSVRIPSRSYGSTNSVGGGDTLPPRGGGWVFDDSCIRPRHGGLKKWNLKRSTNTKIR